MSEDPGRARPERAPGEERKARRVETFVASGLSARRRSGWRSRSCGEDAGNVADGRYDEGNDDDFARPRLSSRLSGFIGRKRQGGKREGILARCAASCIDVGSVAATVAATRVVVPLAAVYADR